MRKYCLVASVALVLGAGAASGVAQPAADQPVTGTDTARSYPVDDGMDLGWIGLLGLAGLLGLRGRATDRADYAATRPSTAAR